jgi:hypothetical protein
MNDYTKITDRQGNPWSRPRVKDLKECIKGLDDDDIVSVYEGEVSGVVFFSITAPHRETKFFKTRP